MNIHVALIDDSEIIKKMLSHCLYYFSAEIFRFNSLADYQSYYSEGKNPDIIFVDWEIKEGEECAIFSLMKKIQSIPVVLTYRLVHQSQVDSVSLDEIPHRITKPLDPQVVRNTFSNLIPKLKESKVHSFLKFPKSKGEQNNHSVFLKDLSEKSKVFKKEPPTSTKPLTVKTHSGLSLKDSSSEKKFAELNQQEKEPFLSKETSSKLKSSTNQKDSLTESHFLKETTKSTQNQPEDEKSLKTFSEISNPTLTEGITQSSSKRLSKEDINIDEDTQNDLAPMAIKSSSSMFQSNKAHEKMELSEKDIVRVLNKYKDTLEFQELMENTLSEYAKKAVVSILEGHKVKDLSKQSLEEFKGSAEFKKIVENEISQYIKTQLPLVVKKIIENEIKKIIGD